MEIPLTAQNIKQESFLYRYIKWPFFRQSSSAQNWLAGEAIIEPGSQIQQTLSGHKIILTITKKILISFIMKTD